MHYYWTARQYLEWLARTVNRRERLVDAQFRHYGSVRATTLFIDFSRDEQGQDLVEYTLLLSFVALASAALAIGGGSSVSGIWTTIYADGGETVRALQQPSAGLAARLCSGGGVSNPADG